MTATLPADPPGLVRPPHRTVAARLGPPPSGLLERVTAADPAAFDALYARYHAPIRNFVGTFFPYGADADDLTQDAFLKAWLALRTGNYDHFEHERKLQGWLYRIAMNVCRDELRHRKLVHFNPLETAVTHPSYHRRGLFLTEDPLDDPVRTVELREGIERANAALAAVPSARERLALRLFECADLSYNEIADALDTSRAAVKSLIFRARESIRQSVSREAFA